jgi:hypothetical protein
MKKLDEIAMHMDDFFAKMKNKINLGIYIYIYIYKSKHMPRLNWA